MAISPATTWWGKKEKKGDTEMDGRLTGFNKDSYRLQPRIKPSLPLAVTSSVSHFPWTGWNGIWPVNDLGVSFTTRPLSSVSKGESLLLYQLHSATAPLRPRCSCHSTAHRTDGKGNKLLLLFLVSLACASAQGNKHCSVTWSAYPMSPSTQFSAPLYNVSNE